MHKWAEDCLKHWWLINYEVIWYSCVKNCGENEGLPARNVVVAPKAKSTKSKAAVLNKTPCKIHTVTSCLGLLGSHLVLFIRTDSNNKFPLVVQCLGWCSMFCHNQQHTLDYRGCFSIKSSISITGFQSNMCTLRVWTNKLRNSEDRGFGTVGKASQVKSVWHLPAPIQWTLPQERQDTNW